MEINEAIELLVRWQDGNDITSFDDVNRAVKLGIEALKHYQQERERRGATKTMWLPGETKE